MEGVPCTESTGPTRHYDHLAELGFLADDSESDLEGGLAHQVGRLLELVLVHLVLSIVHCLLNLLIAFFIFTISGLSLSDSSIQTTQ